MMIFFVHILILLCNCYVAALPEPREPVNYVLNVTDTGTIDPCIEVAAGFPMLPARVSTIKWVVAFTSHVANKSKIKGGRFA